MTGTPTEIRFDGPVSLEIDGEVYAFNDLVIDIGSDSEQLRGVGGKPMTKKSHTIVEIRGDIISPPQTADVERQRVISEIRSKLDDLENRSEGADEP